MITIPTKAPNKNSEIKSTTPFLKACTAGNLSMDLTLLNQIAVASFVIFFYKSF
jgi:hypothetical protein